MTKAPVAAILISALIGCASGSDERVRITITPIADSADVAASPRVSSENIHTIRYAGKWEFVTHRHDGRFQGESARSFHPGDSITIVFSGRRLRIYGIRGKNGGLASLVIPGKPPIELNFYAPEKQTHVLLYDSGRLENPVQTAGIVVTTPHPPRTRGFVNVDEMEALPR